MKICILRRFLASPGMTTVFVVISLTTTSQVKYINTSFENASQLDWQIDSNGVVNIGLIYDRERSSPNRANGHWHFQVQAEQGSDVTIVLKNFENIWNGMPGYPVSEKTNCMVSEDGKQWTHIPGEFTPEKFLKFKVHMETDKVYLASVEPYRISDLDKFLARIKASPLVKITPVGKTVEGRQLEIITIGNPNAPHSIFLRARAHSWEPAGNWIVEGLVNSLLEKDASKYLKRYCVHIMPMTNKDGVARGRTRFNTQGVDLNRKWDAPADSVLAPEKYAFEKWLKQMIAKGKKPALAIDLHNDQGGNVHVNLPKDDNKEYTKNLTRFVDLLFKHTWFTEGIANVTNPGSLGEGLAKRFGVDACIYEFNYEWAGGLKKVPMGDDWKLMGKQLREVFYLYFE
jgi:hypothetical protein